MIVVAVFLIAHIASEAEPSSSINHALIATEEGVVMADINQMQQEAKTKPQEKGTSPYKILGPIPSLIEEKKKAAHYFSDGRHFLDQHGVDFFLSYTSNIAGNSGAGANSNGFT